MDWIEFLSTRAIEYTRRGQSNVAVGCPFCAVQHHVLSVSLRGRGWHCFRNGKHSGRSNARLVQALLGCTWAEAVSISGDDTPPDDASFYASVRAAYAEKEVGEPRRGLVFPPEIRPLGSSILARPFWRYLENDRGFTNGLADWIVDRYGLRYATKGTFAYRLIIPVHDEFGRLVSWTGRSLIPGEKLRYLTLGRDEDDERIVAPNQYLLGTHWLKKTRGRLLFVCEGPFDAMRVSALGHRDGVYGTCLFGLQVSDHQISLLEKLAAIWAIVQLLDGAAWAAAMAIQEQTAGLLNIRYTLPEHIKDPGELSAMDLRSIVEEVENRLRWIKQWRKRDGLVRGRVHG